MDFAKIIIILGMAHQRPVVSIVVLLLLTVISCSGSQP